MRFTWLTLWAFLRIGTNSRVFEHPLTASEAEAARHALRHAPTVRRIASTWRIFGFMVSLKPDEPGKSHLNSWPF
jgi:hypothetical protein